MAKGSTVLAALGLLTAGVIGAGATIYYITRLVQEEEEAEEPAVPGIPIAAPDGSVDITEANYNIDEVLVGTDRHIEVDAGAENISDVSVKFYLTLTFFQAGISMKRDYLYVGDLPPGDSVYWSPTAIFELAERNQSYVLQVAAYATPSFSWPISDRAESMIYVD